MSRNAGICRDHSFVTTTYAPSTTQPSQSCQFEIEPKKGSSRELIMHVCREFSDIEVWKSNVLVASRSDSLTDGLHLSSDVLHWDTQILLNYICNQRRPHPKASCCVPPEVVTSSQLVALTLAASWFATWTFLSSVTLLY